jgi:hypothetical protein
MGSMVVLNILCNGMNIVVKGRAGLAVKIAVGAG